MMAVPTCRMLDAHTTRAAASLARLSAGNRTPISTAMIPMTTRSSTNVNAERAGRCPVNEGEEAARWTDVVIAASSTALANRRGEMLGARAIRKRQRAGVAIESVKCQGQYTGVIS